MYRFRRLGRFCYAPTVSKPFLLKSWNRFSSFCWLRNVFFIRESDWEGNQSYSNFLEVCKLAGVLTTINKPTTGLLSLPNMDNYTATRASRAPAPDFNSNFTLFLFPNPVFDSFIFLLIQQSLSKSICGHFCGNFFWQRLLSSAQIRLLFVRLL